MNVNTEATSRNDNNTCMRCMRGPSNSENTTANNSSSSLIHNGFAIMNSEVANDNVNVAELNNDIHGNAFLRSINQSQLSEMERCARSTRKNFDEMKDMLSKCVKYVQILQQRIEARISKKSQQKNTMYG